MDALRTALKSLSLDATAIAAVTAAAEVEPALLDVIRAAWQASGTSVSAIDRWLVPFSTLFGRTPQLDRYRRDVFAVLLKIHNRAKATRASA